MLLISKSFVEEYVHITTYKQTTLNIFGSSTT